MEHYHKAITKRQKREKDGSTRVPDLTTGAAIPSMYNKMNVKLSKAPFQDKAINEHFCNISTQLGSLNVMQLAPDNVNISYFSKYYKERLLVLRKKVAFCI